MLENERVVEELMAFPDSPRVIYEKNPLQEVACQLSFAPILRIGTEPPVEFQELIRQEYPLFEEIPGVELPPDIPPELSKFLTNEMPFSLPTGSYEFTSADGDWAIDLTRDSLTLTSQNYKSWEEFKDHLLRAFEAVLSIYAPAFFTRVGLTYNNVIRRSELGLEEVQWSELLQSYVACELASDISESVLGIRSEVLVNLDKIDGQVHVRHGLAQSRESNEIGYVVESTFYVQERTEVDATVGILDVFNKQAGNLFRWCIKDPLHEALEPHSG
ncbi:hypothetical protein BH23ACT11_BH23ACT11_09800 [soil metagenome]